MSGGNKINDQGEEILELKWICRAIGALQEESEEWERIREGYLPFLYPFHLHLGIPQHVNLGVVACQGAIAQTMKIDVIV